MDFIRPPANALAPYNSPYAWLTFGLAGGTRSASVGLTASQVYSDGRLGGGLTAASLGITFRPWQYLSVGGVGQNLNNPKSSLGASLERRFGVGAALRPLGRDSLELGVEGGYQEATKNWTPRATLGVYVPYVGRIRGDVAVYGTPWSERREYVASATLDVVAPHVTLTGGGTWGSALGADGSAGYVGGVTVTSWRGSGIPTPKRSIRITITETPGTRDHVHLLQKLWAIAEDRGIEGLVVELQEDPASSLAYAHELSNAIRYVRSRGKKVVCHAETANETGLLVCSQADRFLLTPAGVIMFAGLHSTTPFFGELLTKLGIRAELFRVGEQKCKPEQLTARVGSEACYRAHRENLAQVESELIAEVGGGRHVDPTALRTAVAAGPFMARDALRAHLVDGYAYRDELERVLGEVLGHEPKVVEGADDPIDSTFGVPSSVAVIYVDGLLVPGTNRRIPLLGADIAGSRSVAEALRSARDNSSIKAVVLRIECPGGADTAADAIWREAELTAREKPMVVSMGSIAASGGYITPSSARKVYATPYTTTGSIGVWGGKIDVSPLLTKLGIDIETIRTSSRADFGSPFRSFTDDERRSYGDKIKSSYDQFVGRVANGRHMSVPDVDAVARGRPWMGRQALGHHLVDQLGGLREALTEARQLGDLADDAPVVELPPARRSLLNWVVNAAGFQTLEAEGGGVAASQWSAVFRPIIPLLVLAPEQPLALYLGDPASW